MPRGLQPGLYIYAKGPSGRVTFSYFPSYPQFMGQTCTISYKPANPPGNSKTRKKEKKLDLCELCYYLYFNLVHPSNQCNIKNIYHSIANI